MHRRLLLPLTLLLAALPAAVHSAAFLRLFETPKGEDPAIQQILDEIRQRQPEPYGLPDDSTSNYWWAQNMMAFLAAERCGYM
ncbi:MAG: hypothetical protein JXB04_01555, partial [Kiritimatiellae bacterium]|nr:hypothetical protein [Kiritimatiellia bacterium]